jgi:hypothetical protein
MLHETLASRIVICYLAPAGTPDPKFTEKQREAFLIPLVVIIRAQFSLTRDLKESLNRSYGAGD